ncbi:glycosyltransferase family 2 protein [Bacillus paranthracis]|uniref:glycosyltransferase family 2 protein n=1 Tax=Bacillus paranthracis TaxID=2026186 RepID=UPI000D6B3D19|nr:glycosyltransferase family 2 protein [Bacillus paranthracis]PWN72694.1 glycosyltransferase family 2 protein [Bacillus cereus]MCX3321202.1 glycosyltransferase family 2 protein [Bacillus paranthracis]MEC4620510.1 glycosyltransferase family 2 protein [Bacillus paranthracis]PWN78641.1 glycosyltransferase family 2 protein [Bacillus cereus]UHJ50792.1 glycosyltransferase [Bacillus paranthracis]
MFSIIVPTLGEKTKELQRLLDSLRKQENIEKEIILVVQDNYEQVEKISMEYKDLDINIFNVNFRGLSKARNYALNHIKGDFIVFSDDDCWYPDNIFFSIKKELCSTAVGLVRIYDPNKKEFYKNYKINTQKNIRFLDIFKVSSIEIFINAKFIKKEDIYFDERLGLGAKFSSGEENSLLIDLWRKGYRNMLNIPEIGVFHEKKDKYISDYKSYFYQKGALFSRNFSNVISLTLGIIFLMKKLKLSLKNYVYYKSYIRGMKDLKGSIKKVES